MCFDWVLRLIHATNLAIQNYELLISLEANFQPQNPVGLYIFTKNFNNVVQS